MIGRTNALVRALVSSVNGMTGVVVLDSNIAFDPEEEYENGTLGKALQTSISDDYIENMYGEVIPPPPRPEPEPDY